MWHLAIKVFLTVLPLTLFLARRAGGDWQSSFNSAYERPYTWNGVRVLVAFHNYDGRPVEVRLRYHMRKARGIEIEAQSWLKHGSELVIGIDELDRRYFIRPDSRPFAEALLRDAALRDHLLGLNPMLKRHRSKFVGMRSQGAQLDLACTIGPHHDLDALYVDVIGWLRRLDELLNREPGAKPSPGRTVRPARKPLQPIGR